MVLQKPPTDIILSSPQSEIREFSFFEKLFPQWTALFKWNKTLSACHFEETWFFNSKEEKQRCSLVSQSAGAHLCSWAISWLRSSSSLLPVSSADPVELLLSWGERHRRCENMEVKSTVQQGRKRRIRDDNGGKVRTINEEKRGIQQQNT